jgi:hypothetical protein
MTAARRSAANEASGHHGRARPSAGLVTVAVRHGAASSKPAVPRTCPKDRSAAVIHGQPRFIPIPAEVSDRPVQGGRRVLPKLAVRRH